MQRLRKYQNRHNKRTLYRTRAPPVLSKTLVKIMDLKRIRELKKDSTNMPESMKERLDLWERVILGDAEAMVRLSFINGMISKEQYEDYFNIGKQLSEDDE